MRLHTFLVLVLAFLSLGMGRPSLGIVNPSPSGKRHHTRPKSDLISLRYRKELHRRLRLLDKRSAPAFHTMRIASVAILPASSETAALFRPSAAAPLQLLMRLQE
jgi:hypothetical protein